MAVQHETIVDRVRADHRTIVEQIAELEGRAGAGRKGVQEPTFAVMRTELQAHMVAEEEFVYTLLEREMRMWIENSRREHDRIREHLAALGAGGEMPSAAWLGRLSTMKQALEQHIAEEERAVTPELEMKYDLEKLRDLGDEYARRKTGAG